MSSWVLPTNSLNRRSIHSYRELHCVQQAFLCPVHIKQETPSRAFLRGCKYPFSPQAAELCPWTAFSLGRHHSGTPIKWGFSKFVTTAEIQKTHDKFYIHLASIVPTWTCIHYCKAEHPNKSIELHMNKRILNQSFCIRCATVDSQGTKAEYFTRESPQTNQWIWNVLLQPTSAVSYLMLLLLDAQEIFQHISEGHVTQQPSPERRFFVLLIATFLKHFYT